MSRWARIKAASKRLDGGLMGPGEIFDHQTYRGTFFALLFWCAATYFLWHFDDVFVWYQSLRGIDYKIDPAKQSWARLWALIIGGMGVAGAIMGMVAIPLNRYRARKSAEGQWYDRADLTAKDLRGAWPDEVGKDNPGPAENGRNGKRQG